MQTKRFFSKFLIKNKIFKGFSSNITNIEKIEKNFVEETQKLVESDFNIDKNRLKLIEISKLVFPSINHLSMKSQLQVFHIYTPYNLLDPITFNQIEKNLLKNLNKMEINDLIKFLNTLSRMNNKEFKNERLFLFIQQKLFKNIENFTPNQIIILLESYQRMNIKDHKTYSIFLRVFNVKLKDLSISYALNIMILLIRSKQCDINGILDSLNILLKKINFLIEKMNFKEISLIYYVFFTDFLQLEILNEQYIKNARKNDALKNINYLLLTGNKTEFSDINIIKEENRIFKPKENYIGFSIILENSLNSIIKKNENIIMNFNDICTFINSFNIIEKQLPILLEEILLKNIKKIIFELTPKEIYRIISLSKSSDNINNSLKLSIINEIKLYFDKYLEEFNENELCELLKMLDIYKFYDELKQRLYSILKNKIKSFNINQLSQIFFLSLKEYNNSNKIEMKNFLENQIFDSINLYINMYGINSKELIPLLKLIMNFNSDNTIKEFLSKFIIYFRKKIKIIDAEDFVIIDNFLNFYKEKYPELKENINEITLYLNQNYLKEDLIIKETKN